MRPKFTIRHLVAATGLVAVPCAIVAADHYSRLALGMILAGLLLHPLPGCLAIGIVSSFSRRRKWTAATGVALFLVAWMLVPWEHAAHIQQLAFLSFLTGLVCVIVAHVVVALHSRLTNCSAVKPEPNPTRLLLYLIGGLCALSAFGGFRMQTADPTHLMAALAYLIFAIGTIWLGHREYDATSRILTIAWGVIVSTILASAALFNGTLVLLGFVLLVLVPIPLIAWRQRPTCANA